MFNTFMNDSNTNFDNMSNLAENTALFVVAMPDTPLDVAFAVADRIRVKISEEPIRLPDGSDISVTLSAGVAESLLPDETAADLIARADKALYMAKHDGRDRIIRAEMPVGAPATSD